MKSLKKVSTAIAKIITPVAIGAVLTTPNIVHAQDFVPCSFNYQIISCRLDSLGPGRIRITWSDGKAMTYYGAMRNNDYLRDSKGGMWRYLDFDVGKAFSLSNPNNGNIIIWNGTYRDYGRYVGL